VGDGFAVREGSDNEHQLANAWGLIGVFVREHAFGRPAGGRSCCCCTMTSWTPMS
jgi:hypothetical protein